MSPERRPRNRTGPRAILRPPADAFSVPPEVPCGRSRNPAIADLTPRFRRAV